MQFLPACIAEPEAEKHRELRDGGHDFASTAKEDSQR